MSIGTFSVFFDKLSKFDSRFHQSSITTSLSINSDINMFFKYVFRTFFDIYI